MNGSVHIRDGRYRMVTHVADDGWVGWTDPSLYDLPEHSCSPTTWRRWVSKAVLVDPLRLRVVTEVEARVVAVVVANEDERLWLTLLDRAREERKVVWQVVLEHGHPAFWPPKA